MNIGDPSSGSASEEGSKRKKWPWIVGGVAGGLILIGVLSPNDESPKPAAEVTTSTAVSTTPATTTPAATTTSQAPASTTTAVPPTTTDAPPATIAPPATVETVIAPAPIVAPPEPEAPPAPPVRQAAPEPAPEVKAPSSPNVSYANCAAVRAAGAAPLYSGDPGYSTKLDRDRDGVACE